MDIIKELGVRGIGSYLKRIVEYMLNEVKIVYNEFNIEIEPSWLPFFIAVSTKNGISIKDIAELTNVTHSAASQVVNCMKKKGFVKAEESLDDKRIQYIFMTNRGKDEILKLMPVCDTIKEVVENRFKNTGYDILEIIEKMENEIKRGSVSKEVIKNVIEKNKNKIVIKEYKTIDIIQNRIMVDLKKGSQLIVAEKNGVYVGSLIYKDNKKIIVEYEEIVDEFYKKDVEKILFEAIIKKSINKKYDIIYAEVEPKNFELLNCFYKKGFKAQEYINNKILLKYEI